MRQKLDDGYICENCKATFDDAWTMQSCLGDEEVKEEKLQLAIPTTSIRRVRVSGISTASTKDDKEGSSEEAHDTATGLGKAIMTIAMLAYLS